MKLDHAVRVPAQIEDVWRFLDDIEAVAACMPGAELTETVDESTHRGLVKLAVGPLTMNYAGEIAIVERDDAAHRMRLDASGRDRRGSGTARASIAVELEPDGSATQLRVVSDVKLTGRIASLGRGVQDVSNKLLLDFAERLAANLGHGQVAAVAAPSPQGVTGTIDSSSARRATSPPPGAPTDASSIKLTSLVYAITRERLANFLQRLSDRVRP